MEFSPALKVGQLMPSLSPLKKCCRDANWGGSLSVRSKLCSFFYPAISLVGCNRIEKLDWLDLFSISVVSESLLNGLSLFGSLKKKYTELDDLKSEVGADEWAFNGSFAYWIQFLFTYVYFEFNVFSWR